MDEVTLVGLSVALLIVVAAFVCGVLIYWLSDVFVEWWYGRG